MNPDHLPSPVHTAGRLLSADAYQRLAAVPPEVEWFANLGNKATRRAYKAALQDFMRFAGIVQPDEFRSVTRAHVIAWRDHLVGTLLYHGLRRDELCRLKVRDFKQERRGAPHLKVSGKGDKTRYVPLHPAAGALVLEYLQVAAHGGETGGALFRPLHNGRAQGAAAITMDAVYKIVRAHSAGLGFQVGAHAL